MVFTYKKYLWCTWFRSSFSGSSILQISQQNSDLSRRSIIYTLENLSFREYLELCDIYKFDSFCLEDIFQNHISIATDITKHIKPLMHFKEYLQYGAISIYIRR